MVWEVGLQKELTAPRGRWSSALEGGPRGRRVKGGVQTKLGVGTGRGLSLFTLNWHLILHSWKEEDIQSEVWIWNPQQGFGIPGLKGGEVFPKRLLLRIYRPGLDLTKVLQLLTRPGAPLSQRPASLPLGCAQPLPESPQGERGEKREEKRGIDYRGRKRKQSKGGRREAAQEWVTE